ncbi:LLM class flavin-dependent oxidoreductase [Paraburkholderia sp.]|uniref:LLM class flavin-dependent oxidoreductase n=1 Tax=Paraburkholderia sp. TaxID=1926495 RepID=UPI0023A25299|nr:LLM class flavin-dependent oxidoreductase [Paraburkholderia sp.]MDE1180866.1 LLM class flavin-dependent oxidoreductase [Paraburkholderia sp.]
MKKTIRFNAFLMNCVAHLAPGQWTADDDRATGYLEPEYWTDLARLLERGRFDAVFLGDVLGVYDVYDGGPDAALRQAAQIPMNDPLAVIPLMSQVTEHLCFGVTCSLSYEHPYTFSRRMTTLDHLTRGRIGWNIVTSYLDSAARNIGLDRQLSHDQRYDLADEYMDVCYKLWEGSWEDGAVVKDRVNGIYADPSKVHPIGHEGHYFKVPGFHMCEPSVQRTPVLFQAGSSGRGKQFAGTHAECVFVAAPTRKIIARNVADIRAQASASGRDNAAQIKIFAMLTVVVGRTEDDVRHKIEQYRSRASHEGAAALLSGWTGIDLAAYAPDDTLTYVDTDAGRSALASFSSADPDRVWTVQEAVEYVSLGGRGPLIAGTPAQVADELEAWMDETGLDGFNLTYIAAHRTFEDIVELLVPELQRRGLYRDEYEPGTYRDKLFAAGPRLPSDHPGSRYVR